MNNGTFDNPTWMRLANLADFPYPLPEVKFVFPPPTARVQVTFRANYGVSPLLVCWHAFCEGHRAGKEGRPRDWSEPQIWHAGYLRGRLQRYKETGKAYLEPERIPHAQNPRLLRLAQHNPRLQ